eukprot:jgi/Tetstr1/464526/TSEL_009283.t1
MLARFEDAGVDFTPSTWAVAYADHVARCSGGDSNHAAHEWAAHGLSDICHDVKSALGVGVQILTDPSVLVSLPKGSDGRPADVGLFGYGGIRGNTVAVDTTIAPILGVSTSDPTTALRAAERHKIQKYDEGVRNAAGMLRFVHFAVSEFGSLAPHAEAFLRGRQESGLVSMRGHLLPMRSISHRHTGKPDLEAVALMMSRMTVLVTGANRGIGLEFVRQYLERGSSVIATCRKPSEAEALAKLLESGEGRLRIEELDVASGKSISALCDSLGEDCAIDVLLLNAGIKGDSSGTADDFLQVYKTNAVAPLLLCRSLHAHVARSKQKQIVAISSGVGSISENGSGGMEAYRMSKAALNMAMAGVAVKGQADGIHVLSMVPGWVRTDMGGTNARQTVEESVGAMIDNVIGNKDRYQSGGLYDYTGKQWPF